ncbi:histidine kinase [Arthrobacter sp. SIMBA_036]|uniref:sensor histidine kinase n=1 Tax=Arthrobacter sp. SIMBA_036 TaxID=3085778 RepID=UPI00397AE673
MTTTAIRRAKRRAPGLNARGLNASGIRGPGLSSAGLRGPGPRGWFIGAAFSIILWAGPTWNQVWSVDGPLAWKAAASGSLVAFFGAYAVLPMFCRERGVRAGLACIGVLGALNAIVIYLVGVEALWTWPFLACAIAMMPLPSRVDYVLIGVLAGASLATQLLTGNQDQAFFQPALIVSLGLMMCSFARSIRKTVQLRAAQTELAEAAVAAERSRVARDMHDILGHSLTVIAVKAELAARMLETASGADPASASASVDAAPLRRAAAEIAAVQDLARGALADVRATVAGYRGVNVLAELAVARTALESAGITADLPATVDAVPARHRELFGWVLREGVTNVVRHSGAKQCRVRLTASEVSVEDDGVGPGTAGSFGNGLTGIRERVMAAGGNVCVGKSDLGGFRLAAEV